jgi:hypothetical protein
MVRAQLEHQVGSIHDQQGNGSQATEQQDLHRCKQGHTTAGASRGAGAQRDRSITTTFSSDARQSEQVVWFDECDVSILLLIAVLVSRDPAASGRQEPPQLLCCIMLLPRKHPQGYATSTAMPYLQL